MPNVRIHAGDVRPGDVYLPDGTMVTAVYRTDHGTWVESDDGAEGYLADPDRIITVHR